MLASPASIKINFFQANSCGILCCDMLNRRYKGYTKTRTLNFIGEGEQDG